MSINKIQCNDGQLTLHGDHVVDHQENVTFELKGDRLPPSLQGTNRGDLFLTSTKIIFIGKSSSEKMSFSMEFRSLKDIDVKQPIFGANALTGYVTSEFGGGWEGSANFRVEFKSGGATDFAQRLKATAGQARAGQHQPPVMPAGYYPPPPLGGYYYPPYDTAYGMPQGAAQGQAAPPPYPGNPTQQGFNSADDAKTREAYSSGQNVYVPMQYETPPPYAPNDDKKKTQ